MAGTRYVKQNAKGSWDVLREGDRRSAVHRSTQQAAVRHASTALRKSGGGQILVVNQDGKVTESKAVPRPKRTAGTAQRSRKTA